jgi:hypothetical protein
VRVTIAQCVTSETFAATADDPGVWAYIGHTDEPLPRVLTPWQAGWLERYHRGCFWLPRASVEQRLIVQEREYDTSETHPDDCVSFVSNASFMFP